MLWYYTYININKTIKFAAKQIKQENIVSHEVTQIIERKKCKLYFEVYMHIQAHIFKQ